MAKATSIKDALKELEQREGKSAAEMETISLCGFLPPIEKMDTAPLSGLKNCKRLSLSTNAIEKIGNLQGMDSLQILSLGRNQIKKIENMEFIANTLEQLWISYNLIEKLSGIEKLKKLKVLYMSNNKVDKWSEFDRLKELPELEELLFIGNPLYTATENWRIEVLKRLPHLKKLDGVPVTDEELEEASKY